MKQHRLEFINAELRQGVNSTVRLGTKWDEKAKVGDLVDVFYVGATQPVKTGQIIGKAVLPFCLIPKDMIAYEHDKSCTNHFGLAKAMTRAYKSSFSTSKVCTVLLFDII